MPNDSSQLLRRLHPLGACPLCRDSLCQASDGGHSLVCNRCGIRIGVSSGVVVGLLLDHRGPLESSRASGPRSHWAASIAADMNGKSASYARKYEHYSLESRGYIVRRELALALVGDQPGRVLEAGCGPGVIASVLSERGVDVHGVDLSLEQLVGAAARDDKSLYLQADIHALPYRDGTFDTVMMLGVFEYLERPSAALQEIRRVMRVGGLLVLSAPNIQAVPRLWTQYCYIPIRRAYKRVTAGESPSYSRTLYSLRTLGNRLGDAGFSVQAARFFELELAPPPFHRLAPSVTIRLDDALEDRLGGFLRRLLATQFIVAAEVKPS